MINHHIRLNFTKEELKELDNDFKKLQDNITNRLVIEKTKQLANAMVTLDDYDIRNYKFVTPYDEVDKIGNFVAGFNCSNEQDTYVISFAPYYKGEPIEKALINRFQSERGDG